MRLTPTGPVSLSVTAAVSDVQMMKKATLMPSSYQQCIGFYELDLATGCENDCIYCGLRKSGEPERLDISGVLEGPKPDRGIYMSPNTDAFSEKCSGYAHEILERFLPEGVPFLLITKNVIPDRTIELITDYNDIIITQVSLARLDDEVNRYIEPGAPPAGERLECMKKLAGAGIKVTALMMPAYPGLDDTPEKMEELVGAYAGAGAHYVKAAYAVINRSQGNIVKKMTESTQVPQLGGSWNQMTDEIKVQIGSGNVPPKEKRKEFYMNMNELCERYGMHFTACSVLDPPAHEFRSTEIPVCKSIRTFNNHLKIGGL